MKHTWTKPYYGVTHTGTFSTKTHWVTVCDYGTFATLTCWFPGCGFSALETTHSDATKARSAGEKYLNSHT